MTDADYRVNGHAFEVTTEFQGSEVLTCTDCLIKERLEPDHDPEKRLGLLTPECRFEWVREPEGGFYGVAFRNAGGFSGRELVAVKEHSDGTLSVAERVRVYDEDVSALQRMLDIESWGDGP